MKMQSSFEYMLLLLGVIIIVLLIINSISGGAQDIGEGITNVASQLQ